MVYSMAYAAIDVMDETSANTMANTVYYAMANAMLVAWSFHPNTL